MYGANDSFLTRGKKRERTSVRESHRIFCEILFIYEISPIAFFFLFSSAGWGVRRGVCKKIREPCFISDSSVRTAISVRRIFPSSGWTTRESGDEMDDSSPVPRPPVG